MSVKYTREHEWVRVEGDVAVCGISAYAAEQLGDIVYVELPEPGRAVRKDGEMAVVESAKAASDVFAPVSGAVVAVNETLAANPERVNETPEGDGWIVKVKLSDKGELAALMDKTQYDDYVRSL
ncbi:MAG: glycine cleavage system protein GcvH [Hyphomonadaceae bacterium]